MISFVLMYYLHSQKDPTELIAWTFPRLSLSVLSTLVLWAGAACFGRESS